MQRILFDVSRCHPPAPSRVEYPRRQAEDRVMKTLVKVLIVLGFGASLAGCVVAPYGYGRPRAYVAAPVVVVHPCCERRW